VVSGGLTDVLQPGRNTRPKAPLQALTVSALIDLSSARFFGCHNCGKHASARSVERMASAPVTIDNHLEARLCSFPD
jgi:hypothetical protein